MFSFFSRRSSEPSSQKVTETAAAEDSPATINVEFNMRFGGPKGWPSDTTTMLYDRDQGIIIVGTHSGALHIFGDGFQYMHPCVVEESGEVTHMAILPYGLLFVVYRSNAVAIFDIPSLNVIDVQKEDWMGKKAGYITAIHCDIIGGKSFVYLGTSNGSIFVVDVKPENGIRICDYSIAHRDCGSIGDFVSSLQVCPKDEKYLAIGFCEENSINGGVVIYDLVKRKASKSYDTGAVSGMQWSHTGEVLYVGTKAGEVISLTLDKTAVVTIYNAAQEKPSDDGSGEVYVRDICWLPPQTTTCQGCLFVLFGSDHDLEDMKHVLVVLGPTGPQGDMVSIYGIPAVAGETLLQMQLVPTITAETQNNAIIPGVLLLGAKQSSEDAEESRDAFKSRTLRLMRCPSSQIGDWPLEIGMSPDPRIAKEVLCGSDEITTMTAVSPTSQPFAIVRSIYNQFDVSNRARPLSVSGLSLESSEHDGSIRDASSTNGGRRVSTREFFHGMSAADVNKAIGDSDGFDVVLATTDDSDCDSVKAKPHNTVFFGQADGTVVMWAVSRCPADVNGRASSWFPVTCFRCGSTEISSIAVDENSPFLAIGNISGKVAIWESVDSSDRSYCEYFYEVEHLNDGASEEESAPSETKVVPIFVSANWRECFICSIGEEISTMVSAHETCSVWIGSRSGNVYSLSLSAKAGESRETSMPLQCNIARSSVPKGAVIRILPGKYFHSMDGIIPVVYVFFESGEIVIVNQCSQEVVVQTSALCDVDLSKNTLTADNDSDDGEYVDEESGQPLMSITGIVLNEKREPMSRMDIEEVVKYLAIRKADAEESELSSPQATPDSTSSRSRWFGAKSPEKSPSTNIKSPEKRTSLQPPSNAPKYLVVTKGRDLYELDISKFGSSGNQANRSSSSFYSSSSNVNSDPSVVFSKTLSCRTILDSCVVNIDELNCAWSTSTPAIVCLNSDSAAIVLSLKSKQVICITSFADHVFNLPAGIASGKMLSNCDAFFVKDHNIAFTASLISPTHGSKAPKPVETIPRPLPASSVQQLTHGREKQLAATAAAIKKRRQSIMTITSGPTDLEKLFSKSRERLMKESLLEEEGDEDDDGGEVSGDSNSSARIAAQALASGTMREVKEAFMERGDRINRVHQQSDQMKAGAQEYREAAKSQVQKLRQQSVRWGIF